MVEWINSKSNTKRDLYNKTLNERIKNINTVYLYL
jgi:hypothetical protein